MFYVIRTKVYGPSKKSAKGEWSQELVDGPIMLQTAAGEPNHGSNIRVLWRGDDPKEAGRQLREHKRAAGQA